MIRAGELRKALREKGTITVVEINVQASPGRTLKMRTTKAVALRLLNDLPSDELVVAHRCDVLKRATFEVLNPNGWLEIGGAA